MFENANAVHDYALAGRGVLTLTSEKTGVRYTFKITQALDKATSAPQERWFVSLLTGPENTADYTYLGMLDERGFRTTKASKLTPDSLPVRGFAFFWKHIAAGTMPPQMEVRHEGSCGRCGRALTVPESLDTGLGPECAAKAGVAWKTNA